MIRATLVDKSSPFLGMECALCKHPFSPPDEIVICPEDGSRHHVHCWQANGNRCTAFGCLGAGEVIRTQESEDGRPDTTESETEGGGFRRASKVRVLPSSSLGCAQSCLLVSIALAILLFAVGCFGLWAIADYILIDILGWQYRAPLTGSLDYRTLLATVDAVRVFFL